MLKESIQFPLINFGVLTLYQFVMNNEIRWMDNIGVGFVTFLIMLLYNWSKVPYKWKKEKEDE
ncbi:hypothetical protein MKZ01_07140 [Lysinibacillus endophyticus]|uniref:hypothetical protein n=1 Tax=Ureibacillus endophyticus TaxID=1978490 RepID=UPI003135DA60